MSFRDKDYTHLEGKMVYFCDLPLKVVGCEYDIGITFAKLNGERVICLVNPKTIKGDYHNANIYDKLFVLYLRCISKGKMTKNIGVARRAIKYKGLPKALATLMEMRDTYENIPVDSCAFSK